MKLAKPASRTARPRTLSPQSYPSLMGNVALERLPPVEPLEFVQALRRRLAADPLAAPSMNAAAVRDVKRLRPKLKELEAMLQQAYEAVEDLRRTYPVEDAVLLEILQKAATEAQARAGESTTGPASPAMTAARMRGQQALARRVEDGTLVPSMEFAKRWAVSRQALDQATERGDLFSVKHAGRRFYAAALLELEAEPVYRVCRALGDASGSEKLLFWLRPHGALGGITPAAAIKAGRLGRVLALAHAWAAEHTAPSDTDVPAAHSG